MSTEAAEQTAPPSPAVPISDQQRKGAPLRPFAEVIADVERAAIDWGVHHDEMAGRFVAAMLTAVGWVGQVSQAAQQELRELFRQQQEAAKVEFQAAREISAAAKASLSQTHIAQINLSAEKQELVARMSRELLPAVLRVTADTLVLRESRWKRREAGIQYLLAAGISVGLFLSGYALSAWGESGPTAIGNVCVRHLVHAQNQVWCDVTAYLPPP